MRDDRCAMCGKPWPDGLYCPPCQEVVEEIEACPGCGGKTPDPGELCPCCEDIRDEALRDG